MSSLNHFYPVILKQESNLSKCSSIYSCHIYILRLSSLLVLQLIPFLLVLLIIPRDLLRTGSLVSGRNSWLPQEITFNNCFTCGLFAPHNIYGYCISAGFTVTKNGEVDSTWSMIKASFIGWDEERWGTRTQWVRSLLPLYLSYGVVCTKIISICLVRVC